MFILRADNSPVPTSCSSSAVRKRCSCVSSHVGGSWSPDALRCLNGNTPLRCPRSCHEIPCSADGCPTKEDMLAVTAANGLALRAVSSVQLHLKLAAAGPNLAEQQGSGLGC